jgi:hypothetical protein
MSLAMPRHENEVEPARCELPSPVLRRQRHVTEHSAAHLTPPRFSNQSICTVLDVFRSSGSSLVEQNLRKSGSAPFPGANRAPSDKGRD